MNLKIFVCSICLALVFAIAEAYPRACQYNRDNRVDDVSRCKYGWDEGRLSDSLFEKCD